MLCGAQKLDTKKLEKAESKLKDKQDKRGATELYQPRAN